MWPPLPILVATQGHTGEVLIGIAAIVSAVGLPTIVVTVLNRRDTKQIGVAVDAVNLAVNKQPDNTPRLVERVMNLEARLERTSGEIAAIRATGEAHRVESRDRFDRLETVLARLDKA